MIRARYFRVSVLIATALAAGGCSLIKKGKGPSTPVLGQRIAILSGEGDVTVDPATAALPMSLPQQVVDSDWTQSGGNPTKSMGHLALGTALGRAFTVQAGRGSSLTARLAAAPIAAGGRVYTIDTLGAVRAFDGRSGAQLWASQTPNEKGSERSLYGGGIAYDKGRIYATNGLGYVDLKTQKGVIFHAADGLPYKPISSFQFVSDPTDRSTWFACENFICNISVRV